MILGSPSRSFLKQVELENIVVTTDPKPPF
jgi:hypothetical protein